MFFPFPWRLPLVDNPATLSARKRLPFTMAPSKPKNSGKTPLDHVLCILHVFSLLCALRIRYEHVHGSTPFANKVRAMPTESESCQHLYLVSCCQKTTRYSDERSQANKATYRSKVEDACGSSRKPCPAKNLKDLWPHMQTRLST